MKRYDYVVAGGGLAGLYTALLLAKQGEVALVARASLVDSNSFYAQGGMAAVTDEKDTPYDHFEDTIVAGRGLCNAKAVEILTQEAPDRVRELIDMGMHFDTEEGHLALGLEGGHHHKRILHAGGDATGRLLTSFMIEQVLQEKRISIFDHHVLLSLVVEENECLGIRAYDKEHHVIESFFARMTVVATGGAAALYNPTTNPPSAMGDGIAMALEVGAKIMDPEFIQFHPTALSVPGETAFLISEAVRGEGAHLYNHAEKRFMIGRHPLAELAPRDVVAAEIFKEMQREEKECVYLSLGHLDSMKLRKRFPTIVKHCEHLGIDFTQRIPVAPAAHYTVGGIHTDLDGQSSVRRLFAVGEVASTGIMGANRLASNSLIECLVMGKRIALCAERIHPDFPELSAASHSNWRGIPIDGGREKEWDAQFGSFFMKRLGKILMEEVGIVRSAASLKRAEENITSLEQELVPFVKNTITANMILRRIALAKVIVEACNKRRETRGVHHRGDFPDTLPLARAYRTVVIGKTLTKEPINYVR